MMLLTRLVGIQYWEMSPTSPSSHDVINKISWYSELGGNIPEPLAMMLLTRLVGIQYLELSPTRTSSHDFINKIS